MKVMKLILVIMLSVLLLACTKDNENQLPDLPQLDTPPIAIPDAPIKPEDDENLLPPIIDTVVPPIENKPIKPEVSKLKEIETYLGMIYQSNVKRVWFSTYSNITQHYSYLYLYNGNKTNIISELVNTKYKETRPGIKRNKIDYIVIHDTGNNSIGADARNHSKYINNNPGLSWHYTVDDTSIYQQIPNNEVAYHAGDGLRPTGSTYYNTIYKKTSITGGNMNGIGIETCVDNGSDYGSTLYNTANLVSELMILYNLDIEDVKRHYDFSGKMCPQALIKSGYWEKFIDFVEIAYYYKTQLSDVSIKFYSMSTHMDDQGRVKLSVSKEKNLKYKAVIEYEGQKLEYTFTTQVN